MKESAPFFMRGGSVPFRRGGRRRWGSRPSLPGCAGRVGCAHPPPPPPERHRAPAREALAQRAALVYPEKAPGK